MEPNRSRRDMGRYSQQGRGCGASSAPGVYFPSDGGCGCNDSMENIDQYPIAMAYVPWQKYGKTYEHEKGFQTGTIFPELDLPFTRTRCMK
jgi:hypothetical protein